jgi:hypothetical protein
MVGFARGSGFPAIERGTQQVWRIPAPGWSKLFAAERRYGFEMREWCHLKVKQAENCDSMVQGGQAAVFTCRVGCLHTACRQLTRRTGVVGPAPIYRVWEVDSRFSDVLTRQKPPLPGREADARCWRTRKGSISGHWTRPTNDGEQAARSSQPYGCRVREAQQVDNPGRRQSGRL